MNIKRALILIGSLTLLFSQMARAKTQVIVMSPHGDTMLALAKKEFESEHPKYELNYHFYAAEDIANRIAHGEKVDVWWGGPQFFFIQATHGGLLHPYKPSWSSKVGRTYRDEKNFWHGDLQVPVTIFYNKSVLKSPPKDWGDLLNPEFKNKIVIRDPRTSGTMRTFYSAIIENKAKSLGRSFKAINWVKQLEAQYAKYVSTSTEMIELVGKGTFQIGIWNLAGILPATKTYKNIEFVFPTSGMPVIVDGIALVGKKPNKGAALFYEFVTSSKFQKKLVQPPFYRIPLRVDAAEKKPAYLADKRFRSMKIDWKEVAQSSKGWEATYDSMVFRTDIAPTVKDQ